MELLIRSADASDATVISSILHSAFAEYRHLYTPGGYSSTVPSAQEIADRMDVVETFVVQCAGECIATVGIRLTDNGIYIQSMAVDPDYRGRGVGKMLLEHVETIASREGISRLYLCTTPFLYAAIGLYEKAGFTRVPDGEHDLYGTPLFDMEKRVGN